MELKQNISRTAIVLALSAAAISGISNFVAKIAVTTVKNPVIFTTLKNALVGCFLIGIILIARSHKELRNVSKKTWTQMVLIGVVGGSIPFVLYFTGLSQTTALSASFIHKTLFVWVALLAVMFLKERISKTQGAALVLLIVGTALLGGKGQLHFGKPELLIFLATLLWAIENVIAKQALKNLSSTLLAGSRMVFGSILLIGYVLVQGKGSSLISLSAEQWVWTLIPSVLLLGYVLTWYAALKRAPATLVASLLVPATFITTVLSGLFVTHTISSRDVFSGLFVMGAVGCIAFFSVKSKSQYVAKHEAA